MKQLQENFKIGLDYFLYQPDKTEVILQLYVLNPFYKLLESVLKYIIKLLRKLILYILKVLKTQKLK